MYRLQEISSHPTACGPANNDKRFIALPSTSRGPGGGGGVGGRGCRYELSRSQLVAKCVSGQGGVGVSVSSTIYAVFLAIIL